MTSLKNTINELIPSLYEERAEAMGRPAWIDLSHSHQCQPLTFDLMTALHNRGIVVRRELHEDEAGNWHYLLAHSDIDSQPIQDDIVTDVNPWQWTGNMQYKGALHASREEVMSILQKTGAPPFFIALRSLETITKSHEPRK